MSLIYCGWVCVLSSLKARQDCARHFWLQLNNRTALQCAKSLTEWMWHKPQEMGSIRCPTSPGFPHLHTRQLKSITKTSTGLQEPMFASAAMQPIVSDIWHGPCPQHRHDLISPRSWEIAERRQRHYLMTGQDAACTCCIFRTGPWVLFRRLTPADPGSTFSLAPRPSY